MAPSAPGADVWQPLPRTAWTAAAARHLLLRAGWTARREEVERAVNEGLDATLARLFPVEPRSLPKPAAIERFERELPGLLGAARGARGAEKRMAQQEMRERSQAALQELRVAWLQWAAKPENAAAAKWVLFLSDVYVVSADKVKNASFIWQHFETLATHGLGPAPVLTKAVSRSPAMAMYLDLVRSGREAPNENFARELFELFVLGEGNYSEADVKEAARAFTGYRIEPASGKFRFARRQHDDGEKTIFGRTGRFGGDDLIDLAYEQRAAATFLPAQLARWYLADEPLPVKTLDELSEGWRVSGFDLGVLARTFFGSRGFYAPEFRGNLIKAPVQFYLGLLSDLELEVTPLPRHSAARLRLMGQSLFQPPNVRGWVGGRAWINSSTLAVRRQLVQQLFTPIREDTLTADEQRVVAEARERGADRFTVSDAWLEARAQLGPEEWVETLLGDRAGETMRREWTRFLSDGNAETRNDRMRAALIALLQTPEYQLC